MEHHVTNLMSKYPGEFLKRGLFDFDRFAITGDRLDTCADFGQCRKLNRQRRCGGHRNAGSNRRLQKQTSVHSHPLLISIVRQE